MRGLLLLLVVFLVNLPAVHEGWTDHQVATKGHLVAAIVVDARELHGHYLVDYTLPKKLDPAQTEFSASIDEETYRYAKSSDRIPVMAIPGKPNSNRPEGLVQSSLFTIVAIVADIVLVLIAVIAFYRRRHPADVADPWPKPVGL